MTSSTKKQKMQQNKKAKTAELWLSDGTMMILMGPNVTMAFALQVKEAIENPPQPVQTRVVPAVEVDPSKGLLPEDYIHKGLEHVEITPVSDSMKKLTFLNSSKLNTIGLDVGLEDRLRGEAPPPPFPIEGLFFLNEALELPRRTKYQLRMEREAMKAQKELDGLQVFTKTGPAPRGTRARMKVLNEKIRRAVVALRPKKAKS